MPLMVSLRAERKSLQQQVVAAYRGNHDNGMIKGVEDSVAESRSLGHNANCILSEPCQMPPLRSLPCPEPVEWIVEWAPVGVTNEYASLAHQFGNRLAD
jgi:hypothetical protein